MSEGEPSLFSIEIFGRPSTCVPGRHFNYNTTPAICQEKKAKKINKLFIPKVLTNRHICAIIKIQRTKEIKTMEWIKVKEVHCNGTWLGYTEYVSADGTMGKQVWFDGFEEIYEIEK